MTEIAVNLLLFLSSILGVERYPTEHDGWMIQNSWEENAIGQYVFTATNYDLLKICQKNPSYYIEFPPVIFSHITVSVDNIVVSQTGSPDFQHTNGFYSAPVVSCMQIKDAKSPLEWNIASRTNYFARFAYFPKISTSFPITNFFNESLHIIATGILLILALLYMVMFRGKVSKEKLFSLVGHNIAAAFYFAMTTPAMLGLCVSTLVASKLADIGLWVAMLLFIHFLYLEGLVKKWMNSIYAVVVFFAILVMATAPSIEVVQLGVTIPFSLAFLLMLYALTVLANKRIQQSMVSLFQFLGILIFFVGYTNDVFFVTGVLDIAPLSSIGIAGGYLFFLLSVNEQINHTYSERDRLKGLTKKLRAVNHSLRTAQSQLIKSEKMAAIGRAVARITHELNTPIYSARLSANHIQSQTKQFIDKTKDADKEQLQQHVQTYNDKLKQLFEIFYTSLSRAAELIKNFKEVSVDQVQVKKKPFVLLQYINNVVATMQPSMQKKNITTNISGDDLVINHDPSLIYQVITNLLTNIEKYAYQTGGGIVDICVEILQKYIKIEVRDYGAGISKENQAKIFDAFFTTGGGQGGLGVGLHIVHNIVTSGFNGNISVSSVVGKGTAFTILLPINLVVTDDNNGNT